MPTLELVINRTFKIVKIQLTRNDFIDKMIDLDMNCLEYFLLLIQVPLTHTEIFSAKLKPQHDGNS